MDEKNDNPNPSTQKKIQVTTSQTHKIENQILSQENQSPDQSQIEPVEDGQRLISLTPVSRQIQDPKA